MANSEKWLIVFNCTMIGLANSVRLQAPQLDVTATDFKSFEREFEGRPDMLRDYDLIVTARDFLDRKGNEIFGECPVRTMPIIYFDAYHPDLCYIRTEQGLLKGALGDYHSKIVVAAFKLGIPRNQVKALFDSRHYEDFGYFNYWEQAKRNLLARFSKEQCGIDGFFPNWSRRGAFMHSVNHPAIHAVYDAASVLLDARGMERERPGILPHDNLLNSAIFPIYEEIGESLGVPGSYLFKLPAQYRCINLQQFIDASYDRMEALGDLEIHCLSAQKASFEHVMAAL